MLVNFFQYYNLNCLSCLSVEIYGGDSIGCSGDCSMEITANERRRFERYPVNIGLLFSDNDSLIGLARVVDISACGVRCASLSEIKCTICMLDDIELFGAKEQTSLPGLSGKMIRCSDDIINSDSESRLFYYEFGFEFLPPHYRHINGLMRSLLIQVDDYMKY